MRIAYDAQADALTLALTDGEVVTSRELAPGLIVNLDGQGRAVAVEVLDASRRIGRQGLREIVINLQDL
ncbi:MAG: DUF2283 domain-containing protein [Armatimonadota bacterium]|nr:DUF2283 domain-containing protein [Armatimonadota bacterium]MDR7470870.1 DUF2283 domain-containing protein [Armatimonadota bacterium]MDR7474707.1 DUF2283 domain-containing protein [Armatimonadota bacterium]MDR7538645.1 DUF2283 domain-containing protein [Armatimonadota bacterium]